MGRIVDLKEPIAGEEAVRRIKGLLGLKHGERGLWTGGSTLLISRCVTQYNMERRRRTRRSARSLSVPAQEDRCSKTSKLIFTGLGR